MRYIVWQSEAGVQGLDPSQVPVEHVAPGVSSRWFSPCVTREDEGVPLLEGAPLKPLLALLMRQSVGNIKQVSSGGNVILAHVHATVCAISDYGHLNP